MKAVIKIALLLVGAYLVWLYLSRKLAAPAGAAPQPSQAPSAALSVTPDLVAAAAARAGYPLGSVLNGDQWNYFYAQVRGVPGPDPLEVWPGRHRSYQMTVEEWWAGALAHGLSGLGQRWPLLIRRGAVC